MFNNNIHHYPLLVSMATVPHLYTRISYHIIEIQRFSMLSLPTLNNLFKFCVFMEETHPKPYYFICHPLGIRPDEHNALELKITIYTRPEKWFQTTIIVLCVFDLSTAVNKHSFKVKWSSAHSVWFFKTHRDCCLRFILL